MTRLFTFGCSFTESNWPTWADIVSREYKYFENWAQRGAGNSFIFYSLIECHRRNKISQYDRVMIMWSSIGREDRYVNGKWLTPGSIYNQADYDENFVKKFADPTGYLLRDAAHLAGAKALLDSIGCQYYFFSVVPFNVPDDNIFKVFSTDHKIEQLYYKDFAVVKPSVYEIIFNYNWYNRVGPKDNEKLRAEYEIKRGGEWPTWEKFTEQDFTNIPKHIVDEINVKHNFSNRYLYRYDTHPTTTEYMEYLIKVAPDIDISSTTKAWVLEVTDNIFENKSLAPLWKPAKRPIRF